MNRFLLTLFAAAALYAQDKTALVEVKYADVNRLAALIMGLGVGAAPQAGFKAIVLRAPTPELLAAAQDAIKKLDVPEIPALNVELTVHLLYGSAQDSAADTIPQDLAATVKQLRALFAYKSYRVMESFVLRGRDAQRTATSGTLPGGQNLYDFRYIARVMPGPAPRVVRLDGLAFTLKFAEGGNFFDANISTDLDTREGQKVVVGKSNVRGTSDAILLVVSPKVVE